MKKTDHPEAQTIRNLERRRAEAVTDIKGSSSYPEIHGIMKLFQTKDGVYVVTSMWGLPYREGLCLNTVLAMHIHNGGSCTGNARDPFANAGTHYNPGNCPHPYHAGDMPPLFVNHGYAWSAFFTDRFHVQDVIGLPVIIHAGIDDFHTQPSGNAGDKIACGIIRPAVR